MIRRTAPTGRTLEDGVEDRETPPTSDEPEDEPAAEDDDENEDEDAGTADRGRLSTATLLGSPPVWSSSPR
jgi:hypothetical protein